MVIFHSFLYVYQINGHVRNLNWRYLPYIRPFFRPIVREYPSKIWAMKKKSLKKLRISAHRARAEAGLALSWMFLSAGHKIFPESSPHQVPTMDGYYISQLYPHYSYIFLLVNPYNITTSITIIHCFLIFFPIKRPSFVHLYLITVFLSWYSQDWWVTSIIPELIISQHWFWTLLNWLNHVKSTFLIAKSIFLLYIYIYISHTHLYPIIYNIHIYIYIYISHQNISLYCWV